MPAQSHTHKKHSRRTSEHQTNNLERLTESASDHQYKRKLDKISKTKEEKKKIAYSYLKTIKKMGYDFDESIKSHKNKVEKSKKKRESKKDPFHKERMEFEKKKEEQERLRAEKEKEREEIRAKHDMREKRRKKLNRTNNRGQPILKYQVNDILAKLTGTTNKDEEEE